MQLRTRHLGTGILLGFALCLLSCSASHDTEDSWQVIPLPDISSQPVSLDIAYAVNSRFKELDEGQLTGILRRTEELFKRFFDIDIELKMKVKLSVEELFSRLPQKVLDERRSEIVDIDNISDSEREDMQAAIYRTLSHYSGNERGVIEYARPWLVDPDVEHEDFISLSYALVDTLVTRLQFWRDQQADDDHPVIGNDRYHQWVWWDSLGYGVLPFDVVITNQLVASAERYGMDVHSSIRGGITAGTTTFSRDSRYGSYSYVTVYPMINDSELLAELRQDTHYDEQQVVDYAAALLTHELGHLLLHLGHPFGNSSCIMSPTVMLDYRDWYDGLDEEECEIGSSAAMMPGAARIRYNSRW